MPKQVKPLTAPQVEALKHPNHGDKQSPPVTFNVGGVSGLLLQITASGARSWLLRATIGGKVRHMGLGRYADVSLAEARDAARKAHQAIRDGRDPIEARKRAREDEQYKWFKSKCEVKVVKGTVPGFTVPNGCGVYHLVSEGVIVYVGQSTNVASRIVDHVKAKLMAFDAWEFYPCSVSQLDYIERDHIYQLQPRYNYQGRFKSHTPPNRSERQTTALRRTKFPPSYWWQTTTTVRRTKFSPNSPPEELITVLTVLYEVFEEGVWVSSAKIIDLARDERLLKKALTPVCRVGKELSSRRLSGWLNLHKGVCCGGLMLRGRRAARRMEWTVSPTPSERILTGLAAAFDDDRIGPDEVAEKATEPR